MLKLPFAEKALPVTNRYIDILEAEHVREMARLYEEQLLLQQELARVVELMETEMIPREKMLHGMFEKVSGAYTQATQDLSLAVSSMSQSVAGASGSHDSRRRELFGPLEDTEAELRRIKSLLRQQPVQAPHDLPPAVAKERRLRAAAHAANPGGGSAWTSSSPSPSILDTYTPSACSPGAYSPGAYSTPPRQASFVARGRADDVGGTLLEGRRAGAIYSPGAYGTPPKAGNPSRRAGTIVRSGDTPQEDLFDKMDDNHDGVTDRREWAQGVRGLASRDP